jgi:undecaprenyl-diphosphatase
VIIFGWERAVTNWFSSFAGKNWWLDTMMTALSSKLFGAIFFTGLIIAIFARTERARARWIVSVSLVALVIADLISRHLVKELLVRPRPRFEDHMCMDPHCFGFVSSHATDFFAVASVLVFFNRRNIWWCVPLGVLICCSRLFLFDHFPLDVLAGAALGSIIGGISYFGYRNYWRRRYNGGTTFDSRRSKWEV